MKFKGLTLYFLILIIFAFLIILPLISFFIASLTGVPDGVILLFTNPGSLHFSLSGYLTVFHNSFYRKDIIDTLEMSLSVVALSFLLSLPIAILFSRVETRSKIIIRTILMISLAIPGFIISYVFIILDSISGGSLNGIYSFYGLIGVMTIAMIPFMVNYITLSLNNLDYRMVEASIANGNSRIKTFFGVSLSLYCCIPVPGYIGLEYYCNEVNYE